MTATRNPFTRHAGQRVTITRHGSRWTGVITSTTTSVVYGCELRLDNGHREYLGVYPRDAHAVSITPVGPLASDTMNAGYCSGCGELGCRADAHPGTRCHTLALA